MGALLEGKVAIVTGGGRGLGESVARALAAEGAKVVVADISGDEKGVAESLGDNARAISTDVSSSDAVKEMVDYAVSEFGKLNVLCNNAGIDGELVPMAEVSPEEFDRVIAINLRGVFLGIHHAVPAMLASGGGSIINTSSAVALTASPHIGSYCAAKAGVLGLTRAAAADYSKQGIRVNAICPGVIETAMLTGLEHVRPEVYAHFKAQGESTMIGRIGRPSEIASATVFLASDLSSYVTGATLPVDGGYTA